MGISDDDNMIHLECLLSVCIRERVYSLYCFNLDYFVNRIHKSRLDDVWCNALGS